MTKISPLRANTWFVQRQRRWSVLCLSLLALALTLCVSVGHARTQNAAAASVMPAQGTLRQAIPLGIAGPGGVAMVSPQIGWALSGTVRRSSDGGKTWQTVVQPAAQEAIGWTFVLSAQVTWYQVIDTQTFATIALARTSDGGQTWTRLAWMDPGQTLDGLSVIDGQEAWVTTIDSNNVFHLFLAGGASLPFQEMGQPAPEGASATYALSETSGWASVVHGNDNGNNTWVLYATNDGGQSWTQPVLPMPAGVPATAVVTNLRFLGFGNAQQGSLQVTFGDAASFLIYNTYVYRTQDSGQTWQLTGDAVPANAHVIQVDGWHVVDAAIAFVAVGGQIGLASLQEGHWSVENISLPKNIHSAPFLTVLSPDVLFASTESADFTAQLLYMSRNSSHSWQQIATLPN
ncbi:MAG TPA: hypothetical protein VGF67_15780 [Ktedonobacteraceae bacterium]